MSKIVKLFDSPFIISGKCHYLGVSIGVVLIPDDGNDTVSLMRFADIAMYQAKKENSSRYMYFNQDLVKETYRRSIIKTGLHNALENNELYLQYQPIYDLKNRSLYYVEALVRWKSPELGFVSPEDFITIAEETGLIIDLGYWIIEQSLKDIQTINKETNNNIYVSINVSVIQLREAGFLENLLNLMNKYKIAPETVQLEITENVLIDESILTSGIFQELYNQGFKLAMDDFGTGYSSLSYIQTLPLQTIKIDKAFISDFIDSQNHGALLKTIVFMANAFNLNTVAEGIETQDQDDFLLSTGCQFGQGYLYSRPVSKDEIITMVNEYSKEMVRLQ